MRLFNSLSISGLLLMSLIASCKDDNDDLNNNLTPDEIVGAVPTEPICSVRPLTLECEDEQDIESRSDLVFGAKGMDFKWESTDQMTIYAYNGSAEIFNQYIMKGEPDGASARFKLDRFELSPSTCYLAFVHRMVDNNNGIVNVKDRDEIHVDYSGQVQNGNGKAAVNTKHLGKYDFVVAAAKTGLSEQGTNFEFNHLGLTLYMNFQNFAVDKEGDNTICNPADVFWTDIEMYADDNDYLQPKRSFGLRSGLVDNTTDITYSPYLNPIDIESNRTAPRFSLKLQQDETHPDVGVKLAADGTLQAFMEVPPMDFKGSKKFIFRLTGYLEIKDGNNNVTGHKAVTYYSTYTKSSPLKAGTAVKMNMTPKPTSNFVVTVKVHLDWDHTSVFNQGSSRSMNTSVDPIGDPGLFEQFKKPKFLYAWIFANDEAGRSDRRLKKVKTEENITDDKWDVSVENYILTYDFTFEVRLDAEVEKCYLYAVASKDQLNLPVNQTVNTYCENDIRSLTINLTGNSDENYQDKIKNIWSTPYSDGDDYVGIVYNGMNANMHHVAAKVDVQWNSAYKVNKFSLTHLPLNNLNLFLPTSNNAVNSDPSFTVQNNSFDTDASNWTKSPDPVVSNGCAAYTDTNFDIYQEFSGLTSGDVYEITMQGCYLSSEEGAQNAVLYASAAKVPLSILSGGSTQTDAATQFAAGKYSHSVIGIVGDDGKLRFGVKNENHKTGDLTVFDNFAVKYRGTSLRYTPTTDQWYNGRKVFYVPQTAPVSDGAYKGYTILHVATNREDGHGGNVIKDNNPVPFMADGVFTSWFRGNVTIAQ